jgi:hypothetical protein
LHWRHWSSSIDGIWRTPGVDQTSVDEKRWAPMRPVDALQLMILIGLAVAAGSIASGAAQDSRGGALVSFDAPQSSAQDNNLVSTSKSAESEHDVRQPRPAFQMRPSFGEPSRGSLSLVLSLSMLSGAVFFSMRAADRWNAGRHMSGVALLTAASFLFASGTCGLWLGIDIWRTLF